MSLKWRKATNHLDVAERRGRKSPESREIRFHSRKKQALIYRRVLFALKLVEPCLITGSFYLLGNFDRLTSYARLKLKTDA